MTRNKSKLDEHIIRKYASVSTMATSSSAANEPEKIWGTLGVMAIMNVASQQVRRHVAA